VIDLLKVVNLYKSFGNNKVLKGISFEVKKGTVYGFLGPNGAGKTTTIKILAGLISFDNGEIFFKGMNYKKYKKKILRHIGYLPQNPVFYNYLTPFEYLNFIGEICGIGKTIIKKRVDEVLHIMKLSNVANRKIASFSGGMIQRLGIATAIFNNPDFLLLDEPTSSLDPEGRIEVLEHIKSLKEQGITILFSTHNLNDVERICDEVSILNEGQIIVSENLENLKKKYIQPIFDIEFEKVPPNLNEKLLRLPYVQCVDINHNNVLVYVSNVEVAKQNLIKAIAEFDTPVLSFTLKKPTLEDIFIRVVNINVNV